MTRKDYNMIAGVIKSVRLYHATKGERRILDILSSELEDAFSLDNPDFSSSKWYAYLNKPIKILTVKRIRTKKGDVICIPRLKSVKNTSRW